MTGLKTYVSKEEYDALPETIEVPRDKAFTPAEGGGFRLVAQSVEGWAVEDVTGLKKSLDDRKERHQKAQAELDALKEKLGDLDVDAAREALKRPKQDRGNDKEAEKRAREEAVEAAVEQVRAEYDKKLKPLEERSQAYRSQLERKMIDAEAMAVLDRKETKGSYNLLRHAIRERVRVDEGDDGALSIVVLEADGKPKYSSRGDSVEPARIEDLVKSLREDADYERAFDGTQASGGGTTGAGRSVSGNQTRSSDNGLSPEERLARAWG